MLDVRDDGIIEGTIKNLDEFVEFAEAVAGTLGELVRGYYRELDKLFGTDLMHIPLSKATGFCPQGLVVIDINTHETTLYPWDLAEREVFYR